MGDVFWSLLAGRGLLVTLPALFFGAAIWFLSHLWGAETDRAAVDRARIARFLEDDTPAATYRRLMGWALGRIDAALSGREGARGMGPGRVAFSKGLLQGTMLLAVIYPLLALGLQWVWGSPLRLGAVELAPAGDGWARGFSLAWLWVLGAAAVMARRSPKDTLRFLVFVVLVLGGLLLAGQFGVPASVAVAFAVAVGGAVAVTGVNTFAFAFAFAVAFAVTVAFAVAAAFAFAVAAAFAFAFAFAFAVIVALVFLEDDDSPTPWPWLMLLGLEFLVLASVVQTRPALGERQQQMLVVFLGFLPLLNAVADFASVGLTRLLLRAGLAGRRVLWGLVDLVGGVAIFFLLGFAIIALIHGIRPRDGVMLVDLPGLFAGLKAAPQEYWWLAFMLGSTLIPTFLHAVIWVLALAGHVPRWLRGGTAWLVKDGAESGASAKGGVVALSLLVTAAVWGPVWLAASALHLNHGALLRGVIAVFAGFARAIGAV